MYSQHDEEVYILQAVKGMAPGRFLDLGAANGRTFSNTLALAEMGWSGVLVEPSPEAFIGLVWEHGKNPAMTLIHAAVGLERTIVHFWNSEDLVATNSEAFMRKREKASIYNGCFWIPQITIEDIYNQFGGGFGVVSIDTEGSSADLFFQLRLSATLPKVVCVEHDSRHLEISMYAYNLGYDVAHLNGENLILVRRA